MRPDTLSVILRSASFIALFQAAGMSIFLAMFGLPLAASRSSLQRIAKFSAIAAGGLLVAQYALEAARMADDMSGIVDPLLQVLALHSANSVVLAVRLMGLTIIVNTIGRSNVGTTASVVGATLVAVSFLLTGHTVANPSRWALAPLLTIHVLIVAFWFGALIPLYVACQREPPAVTQRLTEAFSSVALWLVPNVVVAGAALALVLVRHVAELGTGYGLSLLSKLVGFVLLMGFAALNKWRLGPAIAAGDAHARRSFLRSLVTEYLLIAAVLSVTAIMTTLYSPEP